MDPNETLKVIEDQMAGFYAHSSDAPEFDVTVFVDAVAALDGWIKAGGFLPTDWMQK